MVSRDQGRRVIFALRRVSHEVKTQNVPEFETRGVSSSFPVPFAAFSVAAATL